MVIFCYWKWFDVCYKISLLVVVKQSKTKQKPQSLMHVHALITQNANFQNESLVRYFCCCLFVFEVGCFYSHSTNKLMGFL